MAVFGVTTNVFGFTSTILTNDQTPMGNMNMGVQFTAMGASYTALKGPGYAAASLIAADTALAFSMNSFSQNIANGNKITGLCS